MKQLTLGVLKLKESKCKYISLHHFVHLIILDTLIFNLSICTYLYSKDVRLPVQMQRAMAAEAEAARDARAKVIAAEGEQKASRALREAAEVISESPAALQLRYLQTLNSIAAEKNSTIVFPIPLELFQAHFNAISKLPS